MALAFLLAGSVVVVALLSWVESTILSNTSSQRDTQLTFAATAAAQVAIEQQRYVYQDFSTLPVDAETKAWDCTPANLNSASGNSTPVVVFCQIQFQPATTASRVLTLSVCRATYSPTALANCVGTADGRRLADLSAQISFNDYSANGVEACLSMSNRWSCGTGMTINRWQFR